MDDSNHEISWSCSSWLLAVFVILPLWLMASHLLIAVSYVASLFLSVPILVLSYLILGLSNTFLGYP